MTHKQTNNRKVPTMCNVFPWPNRSTNQASELDLFKTPNPSKSNQPPPIKGKATWVDLETIAFFRQALRLLHGSCVHLLSAEQ